VLGNSQIKQSRNEWFAAQWTGLGGVIDAAGDGMLLGLAGARSASSPGSKLEAGKGTTREVLERNAKGADGAASAQVIEREVGEVISRTHVVTKDGKTIHQHQNSIGKAGGERQFPDEWTGTKTINAPYENIAPKFGPDRVPGGRTF
jgi:hypothetical protein